MLIRFGLIAAAIAAIGFLYWQNVEQAESRGYNRCLAEARGNIAAINREVAGNNAEALRRAIEEEGRLKVLSVDALLGVKNIPACAVSECALEDRFLSKLREMRK